MQNENKLTPAETLYIHEILSFKNTCATKASSMQSIVKDAELRGLLNQDVTNSTRQMQELQGVVNSTGTLH